MGDTHSKSFFGQNTGLIVNSSSKTDHSLFIRCIKKKPGGSWEKPSSGEGKVIKCSLDEIVMILEVLNRRQLNWSSYHTFKDKKTQISFGWENDKAKTLWINIANYSKMLNFAQAEILRLLLTHILMEKIKFATLPNRGNFNELPEIELNSNDFKYNIKNVNEQLIFNRNIKPNPYGHGENNRLYHKKNTLSNTPSKNTLSNTPSKNTLFKDMTNISGAIKGETEKALLITFNSGQEIWIPKSTIHCQYSPKKQLNQGFLIDNWILKRNKILA
jgi:hypothetical protein